MSGKGAEKVDPFTVTTDSKEFKSLDFFGQCDSAVNNASNPNMKNLPVWVIGGIWWCLHAGLCLGLTWYFSGGAKFWSATFHAVLLKNVIAQDAITCHHGFHTCYRVLVGSVDHKIKFMVGSIKEPCCAVLGSLPLLGGRRRTVVDIVGHIVFDLARVWLVVSPDPSPACAWLVFGSIVWMYLFDFGEYVGMYGMYHGPWSVFLLAKYYTTDATAQLAATALLQVCLVLLYVGCGIGKMGPWFASVFNQEWTLPPWASAIDLRPCLYGRNFPRDNTPSTLSVVLAYVAASSEWIAPLALMLPASVLGGTTGSFSAPVVGGVFIIIAMHFYINLHMPAFDVWMLNFTPAYLAFNAFCVAALHVDKEPGFDYAGFAALHPAFQIFCYLLAASVCVGQVFPEWVTYMHCFRFWAGNWPQSYVLVSKTGMEKIKKHYPAQYDRGEPLALLKSLQGDMWAVEFFGVFTTAQLPNRTQPMAVHKALVWGAEKRGKPNPDITFVDFQEDGGLFSMGSGLFNWVSGFMVNDALRGQYVMAEMQKDCNFLPGELMLVEGHSFPVLAQLYGGKSRWAVTDASAGLVDEGYVTTAEALAITKPSLWAGYQARGDKPMTTKSDRADNFLKTGLLSSEAKMVKV